MKKNFIILINLFLIFSSSNSAEAHPFSWVYDSGKECLNNMSDVDFWKGACCVMVGIFAVDKCIPLAESTLRFIFRIPKKESEVEKLNKEIVALKAQVNGIEQPQAISEERIQQWLQRWVKNAIEKEDDTKERSDTFSPKPLSEMKKNIDVCKDGIIKICKTLQNHKNRITGLDQRINNIILSSKKEISTSSSSESEEDDSDKIGNRCQYRNEANVLVPRMNFKKLHKMITSPESQNSNYFDSSDASVESTSSSDSNEESTHSTSESNSTLTPRNPNGFWESNSMIINNDSDYDVEEVKDEDGQTEYFVRSPRKKTGNSTPRKRITSQSSLKVNRKGLSESSNKIHTSHKRPSPLKKSSSVPVLLHTTLKSPNSIQRYKIREENSEDDEEFTETFVTEDDENITVPVWLTPSSPGTPKTPISSSIEQFTLIPTEYEGKQVVISDEEKEEVARKRYYLEKPPIDDEMKAAARLKAATEEQCNIG